MLENGDRRYVRKTLGHDHVIFSHWTLRRSKEIECADRPSAKSHRKTVHRTKALVERAWSEVRPPPVCLTQSKIDDCPSASITVDTGTFVRLDLKELQNAHRLTR